ncbi:AAA family ATPase [Micromonospora echinospora]|uniref:AAA family ATPase n=1 Tax=Micromonospora echinospora TaxID=1877 RepID=UPI003672CAEF
MNISNMRNPYDYGNPVRDAELFAGRDNELAQVAYTLDQVGLASPARYVAVHGQRAAGKTSLLNMIELLARQRGHLTVRIDLVSTDVGPHAFFSKLYEELIDATSSEIELTGRDNRPITPRVVRRIASGTSRDDDFPLEFPESLAHAATGGRLSELALRTDLGLLITELQRPIVLLIDEAQLIAGDEDVLSILRTLGMHLRGYVFVLSGTTDLLERVQTVFDHLLRQLEYVTVTRFTEISEVVSCMSRPLASIGLDPEDCFENLGSTADDLLQLTDGNPYEVQFYCHAMFARWQRGNASLMALSPETFDDVRAAMEAGREVRQRPLVTAVRGMNVEQLTALNILCSSLERATVDEVRFAHSIAGIPAMPHQELNRHLSAFIEAGIIERHNDTIRLDGDLSDHIYARLWTVKQLGIQSHHHIQLISSLNFSYLLPRNLQYFLCDLSQTAPFTALRTCCSGMHPSHLEAGLADIDALRPGVKPNFTVTFLHEAILRCGFPEGLDITSVHCSYNGTHAVRWVYSSDADDVDITSLPTFRTMTRVASDLGGELRTERLRLPLKPWSDIIGWLAENADDAMRGELAASHFRTSLRHYGKGQLGETVDHMTTAHRLSPSWESANGLAYVALQTADYRRALHWADCAIELAAAPFNHGLSNYNAAMALLGLAQLGPARQRLSAAAQRLAAMTATEHRSGYLMIPRLNGDVIEFREETDVSLEGAIRAAAELAEVAERYLRLQGG